jgi:excisionase family DNA binding protein
MSLKDILVALPDDALLPVRWVRAQLAAEGDAGAQQGTETPLTGTLDLTVSELATRLGKGASTVRTWLLRGELPGAYRMHGREWRIPVNAIEAMQRAQAKRHRDTATSTLSNDATDLSEWRKHLPAHRPV